MADSQTLREALVAGTLEELDEILAKVATLTSQAAGIEGAVQQATQEIDAAAARLNKAGDNFIAAMNSGVEREKASLKSYIVKTTQTSAAEAVAGQTDVLRRIAAEAFAGELDQRVATLKASLQMAAERPLVPRMLELLMAGALGGVLSLFFVGILLHFLGLLPTR